MFLFWPNQENSASIQADGLGLMSMPVNGGRVREISKTLTYPEWITSSARQTDALITTGEGREVWTRKRLALADPATGDTRYLTGVKTAAGSASWSPDGGLNAFVIGPDAGSVGGGDEARKALHQRRIWIMAPDGSGVRQLTPDSDYRDDHPLWAPDGKTIVFLRHDIRDQMSLWSIGVDGGKPRKISDTNPSNWFGYYGHIDETWFAVSP
jgi:dipeptidyl aminopeptidase/acylaminoacyl peptidase